MEEKVEETMGVFRRTVGFEEKYLPVAQRAHRKELGMDDYLVMHISGLHLAHLTSWQAPEE